MPKRRWTAEEKMQIVLAGLMPEASIAAIRREHKVSQSQFYPPSGSLSAGRGAFLKGGKAALQNGPSGREQELERKLREAQVPSGCYSTYCVFRDCAENYAFLIPFSEGGHRGASTGKTIK
ncbi:MAG: transposase [Bacillota bacterium]